MKNTPPAQVAYLRALVAYARGGCVPAVRVRVAYLRIQAVYLCVMGSYLRAIIRSRHHWSRYQRFTQTLKRGIGPRNFYRLKTALTGGWIRRLTRRLRKAGQIAPVLVGKRSRRSILYIDSRLPHTSHDSGSVRLFEFLRILADTGADITFIPFDLVDHPEASAAVRALGIRVLCGKQINSISAHLKAEGQTYDTVIACRMPFARHYIEDIRTYAPQACIIFDTVDLHFLRLGRQADIQQDDFLAKEAILWRERETRLMQQSACTVVVSEPERAMLAKIVPEVPVFVISNIHRVLAEPCWNEERRSLLYLGNFHHEPNVDAIRHLVRTILPLMRQKLPDIVLEVVGEYPDDSIEDLACPQVVLHGHVPDLQPLFTRARVFAAPLRYGAGVKGKLHMSMSYGVPFVTTSIGAEGMHLRKGESAFIADEDRAFADAIVRLYRDRPLWENMAASAQAVLCAHFSVEVAQAETQRMFAFLDRR